MTTVALALAGMFTVVAVEDVPAVRVEVGSTTCDGFGDTCGDDVAFGGCVAVDIGVGLEVGVGVRREVRVGIGREVGVEVGLMVGVGVGVGVGLGVGVGVGVGSEEQRSKIHPELIA